MSNKISYRIVCNISTEVDREVEKNTYEQTVHIRYLCKVGENAHKFEIESDKIKYLLSPRLEKSTQFLRSTVFAYDWAQVVVTSWGKVIKVANAEELQQRWNKLSTKLSDEYSGDYIDLRLNKITKELSVKDRAWDCFSKYFFFGLIFPGIPMMIGNKNWKRNRNIQLFGYDICEFREEISFHTQENNIQLYKISGERLEPGNLELDKFDGFVKKKINSLLPEQAKVETKFTIEDITTTSSYQLQRVLI